MAGFFKSSLSKNIPSISRTPIGGVRIVRCFVGYNRDNPQIQLSDHKEKLSEKLPYPINGVRKKSTVISPGNWVGAFKKKMFFETMYMGVNDVPIRAYVNL